MIITGVNACVRFIWLLFGGTDEDEEDKTDTKSDDSDSMKLDKKGKSASFCSFTLVYTRNNYLSVRLFDDKTSVLHRERHVILNNFKWL